LTRTLGIGRFVSLALENSLCYLGYPVAFRAWDIPPHLTIPE